MTEQTTINPNQQIQGWVIEAFNLPKKTVVDINKRECIEGQRSSMDTIITVHSCRDHTHEYTIPKLPNNIRYEDIELLRTGNEHEHHIYKKNTVLGYLFRFSIWWLSLSGLYMMFAACPCCGQVGCPVGAGTAGLVGGVFALCKQNWRGPIRFIYGRLFRGK
ncbi:MAG: hypothetical protein C4291_11660 [Candidatus Dadabacteria bacterium]